MLEELVAGSFRRNVQTAAIVPVPVIDISIFKLILQKVTLLLNY